MKKKNEYFLEDYYALRMPSQSVESILEFNEEINRADLEDTATVLRLLDKLFAQPLFREAIFVSSKEFYARYLELRNREQHDHEKLKRFLISFYKYYSRMSHRCTPYGLFAGLTSGHIADGATQIAFQDDKYRPIFQFNIHSITDLIRKINPLDPSIINTVKYYVNNTLYTMRDKMYFVEKVDKEGFLVSNLTSIGLNPYIQGILDRAKDGATAQELAMSMDIPDVTYEQKIGFIYNLISSQVLISEFWPSVSTDDFTADFLNKARAKQAQLPQVDDVESVYNMFDKVNTIDDIQLVRDHLAVQNEESISREKDFFKVDLFYNMKSNSISKKAIEEITQASYELMNITAPITANTLKIFMEAFHDKFEERAVPLVQALDPNYGIGYGLVAGDGTAAYTPLIAGLPITPPSNDQQGIDAKFEGLRRQSLNQYYKDKKKVVKIDKVVKEWLAEDNPKFDTRNITSAYIFGSLMSESAEALDKGDFKFRPVQLHSPYTARLFSRFLHGDEFLKQKVKESAAKEQAANPDVILAEVINIPDGKFANISLYPNLRAYEIPYLSSSKLDRLQQIDINDLMVSVRNGRVVLSSARLNKEVIPCLSNTFDAGFGNPLFQFLSAVSYQNITHGFVWEWGFLYYNEPFLPRIEYKNLVLCRARWFIKKTNVNYKDKAATKKYFEQLRKERELPRYVIIPDGDNEFLIDLDNEICQYILAKEIKRRDVILEEFMKTPDQCFIEDKGQHFSNELLIPIATDRAMPRGYTPDHSVVAREARQRVYFPGSDWLFVKIYSGSKILEDVLTEVVGPFAEELMEKKIIDKWFFLRYADPQYHLRVRFHRSAKTDNAEWYKILEQLQKRLGTLIQEEQAVKIVVDTYKREIERYGPRTIEESEAIFCADSVAITEFASMIYGNQGEDLRWKFALVSVDRLLDDFNYSIEEKRNLLRILSGNFFAEFNEHNEDKGKALSKTLRSRFRDNRQTIIDMLSDIIKDPELADAYECFTKRSKKLADIVPQMDIASEALKHDLLASYIHMSMNRIFLINQRKHELVVYYFLSKHYDSVLAQQKQNTYEYASRS